MEGIKVQHPSLDSLSFLPCPKYSRVLILEPFKSVFLWQVFFLSSLVFIKISICLTSLRMTVIKWHRTTVWMIIIVTAVSTIFVHNTNSTELLETGRAQKSRDQSDSERIVITVDQHVDDEARATPESELRPQYHAKSYF